MRGRKKRSTTPLVESISTNNPHAAPAIQGLRAEQALRQEPISCGQRISLDPAIVSRLSVANVRANAQSRTRAYPRGLETGQSVVLIVEAWNDFREAQHP